MSVSIVLILIVFLLFITGTFEVSTTTTANKYVLDDLNTTRPRRESTGEGCVLPPYPEHGEWKVLNGVAKPGDKVPKSSVLSFQCNIGYKLSRTQYMICNDKWSSQKIPECEALCPALYPSSTMQLKCIDKRGKEIPCTEATEGTYLTYNCTPFYETPFGYKKTLICSEGSWNYPKPVCQPVCGKIIKNDAKPLIYGSKPNTKLEYPWVAAIYQKINNDIINICGGSILSLKVVITAAHCVTNDYGDVLPKEDYHVGVGKLHNKYQAREDELAQYLEVSKIIVHDHYKGDRKRFLADLAILVTKTTFVLNEVVQPVCFNDVNNIPLHAGSKGIISGWGKAEGGVASDVLRTLEIPYKYETTCAQELTPEWGDKYNMIDKICAGFINKNISVCSGDSGSGLAFKNPEDNRYYIHGLVSLGPTTQDGECDIQQNSLYTKVAFYYEYIDRLLSKHSPVIKDCVLPSHPQNGKWTIDKQQRKPGDVVASNIVLKVKCNLGYKLSSTITNIECASARNMPTCQLLCPVLMFPSGTDFRCSDKAGKTINCVVAVDGATLLYSCPKGYKFPEGTTNVRSCVEGSWGSPLPQCLPDKATPVTLLPPTSVTTQPIEIPTGTLHPTTYDDYAPKVICEYLAERFYESNVDPDDLDSALCTHVIYSSVGLESDGSLKIQGSPIPAGGSKSLYYKVADMKTRNPKLKVLLRVEGSGNANAEFPTIAGSTEKSNTFVSSAISFMEIYKFDGLDVYWNVPQSDQRQKFLDLLLAVKMAFEPRGWLLCASVYNTPTYLGYSPIRMNEVVDWINIHNYNNYDAKSGYTGQFSAFKAGSMEDDWSVQLSNLVNVVGTWIYDGMKKHKIAPSIAFYGRYFTLENPRKHGVHAPTVRGESEIIPYSEICQKYSNWTRVWDNEQENPYRYSGNKWFGYDDSESVKIKADYIREQELFGVHIHSLDADDVQGKCGPKQALLKYVLLGLERNVSL